MPREYKHWTPEDLAYLEAEYASATIDQLAERMNRTVDSIKGKLAKRDIRKRKGPRQFWTVREDDFLRDNYPDHGREHCALALERSPWSVGARANRLGLIRSYRLQGKVKP